MSKARTTRTRRLNLRALAILVGVLVMALPGLIGLKMLQERRGRSAYLGEAKTLLAKNQPALALSYLNRYLLLNPRDTEALELKANLLADAALNTARINRTIAQPQLDEAAQTLTQLIALDPSGADRSRTRRKLLEVNLELDGRAAIATDQAEQIILQTFDLRPEEGKAQVSIQNKARALVAATKTAGAKAPAEALEMAALLRLSARAWEQYSTYGTDEGQSKARLQRARQDYESAERLQPGDVGGAELLATLYLTRLQDPDKAREVLDRAVESTKGDAPVHSRALLARHRFHVQIGQRPGLEPDKARTEFQAAQADIDEAVAADPTGIETRVAAASFAMLRRDPAAASKHLDAIPADRRDNRAVRMIEGMIALAQQRRDAAIEVWRASLLQSGGSDAEMTWKLASVLLEANRVDEARPLIEQYRRLVGGKEPTPRYDFLRGFVELKANRPREALAILEPLRYTINRKDTGDPANLGSLEPSLYYILGQAYQAARDQTRALEAFRQSAEMSPEWNPPWLAAAAILRETKPADAIALLQRGLATNPAEPQMLAELARILYGQQMVKPEAQRDWTEIERLINQAAAAAPGSPEVAMVRAEYRAAIGHWEEAEGLLEVASRMHPGSVEIWLARVNAALRRNQIGRALTVLDEAIVKAGSRAEFYLAKATVSALKGDVSASRDALNEGLTRVPQEQRSQILKALGELYQVRRDFVNARSAFESWARLSPSDPAPRVALVDLAIASGDEDAIAKAIEGVRDVSGAKGIYWRYARVEDLMRRRKGEAADAPPSADRVKQALALVEEIKAADQRNYLGSFLEARVRERAGEIDAAIAAYRAALKLNAGNTALTPLVNLLVREKRDKDLDAVRDSLGDAAGELDKIAAVAALRAGNKGRAEQLAAMAVEGNPQGLDLRLWQAEVLRAADKPKEAEEALVKITQDPVKGAEPAPWLHLLMLRINQNRQADGAATVELMREKVKAPNLSLLLAQCYRALGNMPRAAASYAEAMRQSPNDAAVIASAVLFYQSNGMRDEAERTLRGILSRDPFQPWARRALALSLAGHANDQAAWEEAVRMIGPDASPNDTAEDLVTRARIHALGPTPAQRHKAVEILEKLAVELPELGGIQETLARLQDAEGQTEKARDHAARAAASDQATAEALLLHAALLVKLKDLDAAEAQIERASKIEPGSLPVAEQRARLLVARGKPAEGAAVMEQAFDANANLPNFAMVGRQIVLLIRGWGQNDAAERVARKLAERSTDGRALLAELLAASGKIDDAIAELDRTSKEGDPDAAGGAALNLAVGPKADPRWLERAGRYLADAVNRRPNSLVLLEKLALARHLQGNFAEEIKVYQAILDQNPSNFEFLNNMAWTLSEEMGKPEQGLERANEALGKAGRKAAFLDTRGVILTRLKRFDEAIADLQAAVGEAPTASFYFHLARACRGAGKLDDARKYAGLARQAGLTREQLQPSEIADFDAIMTL